MPIVIGVDAHKKTHTAVAVDEVTGKQIDEITVAARDKGFERLLAWAQRLDAERTFAIEDCRHVSGGLERFLIPRGERAVRVPTKLMAGSRRSGRERGKSDPIDALAAARAALREADLPTARLDGPERDLRLLVDHRETLVWQRSEAQSKLRWLLHELDPELEIAPRALDRIVVLDRVAQRLESLAMDVRVEICLELLGQIKTVTTRVNALEARIKTMTEQLAPGLLELPGCGPLTAAKIIGETAGVDRFSSEAKFAMHAGIAPLPVWSGAKTRFRLNRSGNRQLNVAIHRIAVTQMRMHQPAKDFMARKMSEGKTKTEALRSLKRHIARKVYDTMIKHTIKTPTGLQSVAA
ncbi:MAG: IS110 family transposase [Actinobacteria bacterium]|nr:IS110 family transposase [Actinomycetota bacterium]